MKKALLVGSSFSAAPIFSILKKRGLHVSVCGSRKEDPCHQYSDASFYIDYSDQEKLLQLVEKEKFDYVVPTCNDYSYLSCASFAERLGYTGFDNLNVAKIIHTKQEFRKITRQFNIPAPQTINCLENEDFNADLIRYPLLVKPIDSFSGRGVTKVFNASEIEKAVDFARKSSRCGEIVLEEFVDGTLHSHSAFIHNGKISIDFFADEFCTVYPYQVNCSNHPSRLNTEIQDAVRKTITNLAHQLHLKDGLLHTQFIADGQQHWIIECMRRCPGDLYGAMIEQSTGIPYTDLFVRPFLGEEITLVAREQADKPVGRHTITVQKNTSFYSFSDNIPAVKTNIIPLKNSGELLIQAPFDKAAILLAEYPDNSTMIDITSQLAEFITIESLEKRYYGK